MYNITNSLYRELVPQTQEDAEKKPQVVDHSTEEKNFFPFDDLPKDMQHCIAHFIGYEGLSRLIRSNPEMVPQLNHINLSNSKDPYVQKIKDRLEKIVSRNSFKHSYPKSKLQVKKDQLSLRQLAFLEQFDIRDTVNTYHANFKVTKCSSDIQAILDKKTLLTTEEFDKLKKYAHAMIKIMGHLVEAKKLMANPLVTLAFKLDNAFWSSSDTVIEKGDLFDNED